MRPHGPDDRELREAVRAEAEGFRPDRDAILDRLNRTGTRPARRSTARLLIAGAAAAVTAVLGGGGFVQWSLAADGDPQPDPSPVIISPAPGPTEADRSATPPPPEATTTSTTGATSSTSAASTPDAADAVRARGTVDAGGSEQASSVVTVTTTERIDALEVTIRLARTPGLTARTGSQQVPGASVTTTVADGQEALVYRFVLSSGDVVEPGTYTFAARYTFAEGGRHAGDDTFALTASTGSGADVEVTGGFG